MPDSTVRHGLRGTQEAGQRQGCSSQRNSSSIHRAETPCCCPQLLPPVATPATHCTGIHPNSLPTSPSAPSQPCRGRQHSGRCWVESPQAGPRAGMVARPPTVESAAGMDAPAPGPAAARCRSAPSPRSTPPWLGGRLPRAAAHVGSRGSSQGPGAAAACLHCSAAPASWPAD